MPWTVKMALLLVIPASFVMLTAAANVYIRYDSVSLHALCPPVGDPLPSHHIDSVKLLLKLLVSSDVREERGDVPGRRHRKPARGRRSGVRVRLRRRGIRTPLPALIFGNARSLRNKTDEFPVNCKYIHEYRGSARSHCTDRNVVAREMWTGLTTWMDSC